VLQFSRAKLACRRVYIEQPVFLLSCGYVFLYCNGA
jgi:hypothetical protein